MFFLQLIIMPINFLIPGRLCTEFLIRTAMGTETERITYKNIGVVRTPRTLHPGYASPKSIRENPDIKLYGHLLVVSGIEFSSAMATRKAALTAFSHR